ncbi:R3H-associated N-terminal domain-containing protein [Xylariaceae sp. FL1272]|nr:R3H-associated N-terminal domain-containing protein [Xylariaceae sp. FL1272]
MAIYSAVPPPPALGGATQEQPQSQQQNATAANAPASQIANAVDIEAWTISALESLSVSPDARGTGLPLAIPLNDADKKKAAFAINDPRAVSGGVTPPPRPPSRRDSMRRREALLRGKEGSRQRRRWENDRLVGVPNAIPPEPQDFVPRPTHPVNHVPYQIAAHWELHVRRDVESRNAALVKRKQALTRTLGDEGVAGRVPRELCIRAKKTPVVRTWVRSLEEPVRKYLVERHVAKESENDLKTDDSESFSDSMDSEDEEIVFVGRNGSMRDGRGSGKSKRQEPSWKKARRQQEGQAKDEGMLFDPHGDEDGGNFRRWITHSISDYYGLQSRSVLVGEPKRKVVYVGIKEMKTGHAPPVLHAEALPRPLWTLC